MRRTPARGVLDLEALQGLFRRIERLDKIVVAAINGQALSIGCELALACDVRYIADDARAIGLPEMTLGLLPGGGGTQRLARTVGQARALELILEATLLTPQAALEIGLVHRVVPHAQLLDEALATATGSRGGRPCPSRGRSVRCSRERAARCRRGSRSSGSGSWRRPIARHGFLENSRKDRVSEILGDGEAVSYTPRRDRLSAARDLGSPQRESLTAR